MLTLFFLRVLCINKLIIEAILLTLHICCVLQVSSCCLVLVNSGFPPSITRSFFCYDLQLVVHMCVVIRFATLLHCFEFLLPILFDCFLRFKITVLVSQFARARFVFFAAI